MGHKPGDNDKHERSLELPSLRLPGMGRKKAKRPAGRRVAGRGEESAPARSEPFPDQPDTAAPQPDPWTEPQPDPWTEPQPDPWTEPQPDAWTEPQPDAWTEPVAAPAEHQWPQADPPAHEPTQPLPSVSTATEQPVTTSRRRSQKAARRRFPAGIATFLTGLLVGGFGTGLTYLGLQGCEVVWGTDSCGGGPGLLLLVGILALMVLFGSLVLKLFRVSEPAGTSFLGVGIVTVVAMLGLLDMIFTVWMFAVVPALSAVAYVVSRWVTKRFAEEPVGPEPHDVR